ncbi:MAG: hypothetical protein U0903_02330 [Planctomycetales bacterium]
MSTTLALHVLVSLVGIFSGVVVTFGFLAGKKLEGWNEVFLGTTIATSASGFLLPAKTFLPSHALAIISLVVLAVAVYARYGSKLAGSWENSYVVSALFAQYLNVLVLVVQSFQKVPVALGADPNQVAGGMPVVQLVVLAGFVYLGWKSLHEPKVSATVR